MTTDEAYKVVRGETNLTERLAAHHQILKFGMRDAGEVAREIQMAEALADIAQALAKLVP